MVQDSLICELNFLHYCPHVISLTPPVSFAVDDELYSEEAIQGLEEAIRDMEQGRLIPESRIMKENGVK